MSFESLRTVVGSDSRGHRDALVTAFAAAGLRDLRWAVDGGDLFDRVCLRSYDLVVIDFEVTRDALTVLRQIRWSDRNPHQRVPVLVLTAYANRQNIEAIRDGGADEVIARPLDAGKVIRRLTAITTARRPFIAVHRYRGPDRRRLMDARFRGPFQRATDRDAYDIKAQ